VVAPDGLNNERLYIWHTGLPADFPRWFQGVFLQPAIHIRFGGVVAFGDELLGRTVVQQGLNLWTVGVQLTFPTTAWPSKFYSC
jgi:hypothetical protein